MKMNDEGEWISGEDALSMLGLSVEEIDKAEEELGTRGPRDQRICVCGHPVSRHTMTSGVVYCKPARMECPCKKIRPVLEAQDTRAFLRKTEGLGGMHALSRGIRAILAKGKSVRWIVDLECDRCGSSSETVIPAAVTQRGIPTEHATGFDALLCPKCATEI
jgi:hypothetical protein